MQQAFYRDTHAVKNLILINVIMFVATLGAAYGMNIDLVRWLGLFYIDSDAFQPYQFVTSMFMHGGIMHIAFNMYGLWLFGSILERVWGPKRFLFYYLFTGLGAAALWMGVTAWEVYDLSGAIMANGTDLSGLSESTMNSLGNIYYTPVVGASGAIFGILLAFGVLFPNTELMLLFVPVPIKAKYFVIGYGVIELYLGITRFQGDNIAHFAHIGGMLFGLILLLIWRQNKQRFY